MEATKHTAPKNETPTHDQAPGVSGEQSELFDLPAFCPILPPGGSAAEQALNDLLVRDITQIDWLESGNGWRLAAAVKQLDYLGWEPQSIRVQCNGWGRPIARYSLTQRAKKAAFTLHQGGGL